LFLLCCVFPNSLSVNSSFLPYWHWSWFMFGLFKLVSVFSVSVCFLVFCWSIDLMSE
jgi:hypothetical protein